MDKNSETKQNNVFITLLVIIMTVAVVVAVAGAVAKNVSEPKKEEKTADTARDAALREDRVHDAEEEVTLADTEQPTDDTEEDTAAESGDNAPTDEKEDVFAPESLPDFICPVDGEILKGHSIDVPVFSATMEDYRTHNGIDIYAEAGSEVLASAGGTVRDVWSDPMMGQCVSLSHPGGAVTTYKNLSPEIAEGIEKDAEVSAGQVIGCIGDTALEEVAEESHLHFEMSVDGVSTDPTEYITFSAAEDFSE